MRRLFVPVLVAAASASAQQPFTLQQILSAPYALSLTAAPSGERFAWIENAEGVRNIWIGGPHEPAHSLTHYVNDDGQDLTGLTWSPDATRVAFARGAETGASGKPATPAHLQQPTPLEVWVQKIAEADPVSVGEGHSPLFTRDGRSILFVRAGKIFSACLEGCASEHQATPGTAAVLPASQTVATSSQLVFDRGTAHDLALSLDGSQLAFISRRGEPNQPSHSFLALFDLRSHSLRFPAPSTGNDSAPSFSPDNKQLAWLRAPFTQAPEFATNRTSPNTWSIQALDLASGATRTVFAPEANKPGSVLPHLATGEPHLFWAAGNRIVFFSEADSWLHLYLLSPGSGQPPLLLTPGEYEVEDAFLDHDETLLFASNSAPSDPLDRDRRHLWQVDLSHQSKPKPAQLTHGSGIETHPVTSGRQMAALVSDARTPMHVEYIDPRVILEARAHPFPVAYPATRFVAPQQVIFPAADKLVPLHAQLFLPATPHGTQRPAILFFHGGPRRQMLLGYPAMDYYSNAYAMNQYLASRGYIVLSVNYRCGIGYGMKFRQCEQAGADGASEYNDVLGAAAYLRSRPDVDPARIGVWGGSYGGYLTALALARNSDLFAAGVDFHGVHEWSLEDNASADWLRGTLPEQQHIAERAHASSPMADIARWRSPVLLIHGDDDPDVAYAQTPILAEALRARHVPVEELIFPDEVHTFLLHSDWLAAYQAAADFFDRKLKAAAVPVK